jgi:voltage-gated sodium channel type IX alpha
MEKYENVLNKFTSIKDIFENRMKPRVVQSKRRRKDQQTLSIDDFVSKSLYIFDKSNRFRIFITNIVVSRLFDIFIICLIIMNSLILGIVDYNDNNEKTWRNDINNYSDPAFIFLFTIEMIMKIVAFGFILGENTYLNDKWNWIDFFVVISSLLSLLPQFDNYSVFRTFRLLRSLRSLNSMQNMKLLVATLLSSLTQLSEVLVFTLFFFLIFAIMGVSLWGGSIHYRCRETATPVNGDWVAVSTDTELCGYRK